MKNSSDTIGNRTHNLLACRAVPQPTVPPCAPNIFRVIYIYIYIYICVCVCVCVCINSELRNINIYLHTTCILPNITSPIITNFSHQHHKRTWLNHFEPPNSDRKYTLLFNKEYYILCYKIQQH
jgi:hypothetical protein